MTRHQISMTSLACAGLIVGLLICGCSDGSSTNSSGEKTWAWGPMGTGANNYVWASGIYNDKLVVSGEFDSCGGISASHIAAWNGSDWEPLGSGLNATAMAFCEYNDKLYTGGYMTEAGGVSAPYIASWDGASWSALGDGGMNNSVFALCTFKHPSYFEPFIIIGGQFTHAGIYDDVDYPYIAATHGGNFLRPGSGMNRAVHSLVEYDSKLIAGGWFTTAGGVASNYIADFDGLHGMSTSEWSPLGTGMAGGTNTGVYSLAVYDGKLIAGGNFTSAGGVSANHIAAWDGSTWSALGTGMGGTFGGNPAVVDLEVFDGKLIACGNFVTAGDIGVNGIASWDGTEWAPIGSGMNAMVESVTSMGDRLIATGTFTKAGGVDANYVAEWKLR